MVASIRLEDYLETIFSIEISGAEPTVTRIADKLVLTKGTVVTGVKKLVNDLMLEHEPYGSVKLTEAGREKALKIYRRHEIISNLFTEMLGMDKSQSNNLACIMEHEMDEKTEQKLLALGEYFFRCRREDQDWVVRLEEELKNENSLPKPLVMMPQGDPCTIVRISATGLLRSRLLEKGLVPCTSVSIVRTAPLKGPILIRVRGMDLSLRRSEAITVWVRVDPEKGRTGGGN